VLTAVAFVGGGLIALVVAWVAGALVLDSVGVWNHEDTTLVYVVTPLIGGATGAVVVGALWVFGWLAQNREKRLAGSIGDAVLVTFSIMPFAAFAILFAVGGVADLLGSDFLNRPMANDEFSVIYVSIILAGSIGFGVGVYLGNDEKDRRESVSSTGMRQHDQREWRVTCPDCGKGLHTLNGLKQHRSAKHSHLDPAH